MPLHSLLKNFVQAAKLSTSPSYLRVNHKFAKEKESASQQKKRGRGYLSFFINHTNQILGELRKQHAEATEKNEVVQKNLRQENQQLRERNRDLEMELYMVKTEYIRYYENFELRGALEAIVKEAEREGIIEPTKHGKQSSLNKLAKHKTFLEIVQSESKTRKLEPGIVQSQITFLYKLYSAYAHSHEDDIVIRAADHPPYRRAALVALFKFQDRWQYPTKWHEQKKGSGKWGL